eukprot:UN00180
MALKFEKKRAAPKAKVTKKAPVKKTVRKMTTKTHKPVAMTPSSMKKAVPAQMPTFFTTKRHFSLNTPGATFYTQDHEYIKFETPTTAFVGISNHAQESLGDIVYVDNAQVGLAVAKAERFASVESVKASSDVFAPIAFKVLKINEQLESNSALVNESAEDQGWFAHVEVTDPTELSSLMDKNAYAEYLKTCDH